MVMTWGDFFHGCYMDLGFGCEKEFACGNICQTDTLDLFNLFSNIYLVSLSKFRFIQ